MALFPHWIVLAYLLKMEWPYLLQVYFWTLFYPYTTHTILITIASQLVLKSGYKTTLVLFFFKTVLAILCLLHFIEVLDSVCQFPKRRRKASWEVCVHRTIWRKMTSKHCCVFWSMNMVSLNHVFMLVTLKFIVYQNYPKSLLKTWLTELRSPQCWIWINWKFIYPTHVWWF